MIFTTIILMGCEPEYIRNNKKHLVNNPNRELLINLLSINKNDFISKEVGRFMNNEFIKKYKIYSFAGQDRIGVLEELTLAYDLRYRVVIRIIPNELKFTKKFNSRCNWKLDDFKKETIKDLKLFYVNEENDLVQLRW